MMCCVLALFPTVWRCAPGTVLQPSLMRELSARTFDSDPPDCRCIEAPCGGPRWGGEIILLVAS